MASDFTESDWACFEDMSKTLHQKIARMADRCALLKLVHPSERTSAHLASALMACHNHVASVDVLYGTFCDLKTALVSMRRCVNIVTIWDYPASPHGLPGNEFSAAYPDAQPINKSIDHSRCASALVQTTPFKSGA